LKKYKLSLEEKDVNLILQALGELPAKVSIGLILEIQKQCKPEHKE